MKSIFTIIGLLFTTALISQNIIGNWEGALQIQRTEIPIIFHIDKNNAGKYVATFDSPKQKAFNMDCGEVVLKEDSLVIMIPIIKGSYAGKLDENKKQLTGTWYQGAGSLPLNLKKSSGVTSAKIINRPQTPKPPFPYKSEEVVYDNADRSIRFGATFTVPLPDPTVEYFRAPIYPTVILITGSGQQDRDETIMGHKPFAVMADYLTRQGIAVLRVDDRGAGKTTGNFSTATSADFAKDVEAGIVYLKSREDVDTANIGLIGHSEGGLIAPMVAAKRKDVQFIVLLAGPGITILNLMEQQSADVMASVGVLKTDIDLYRPLYKNIVTGILNAKDTVAAAKKAVAVFKQWQLVTRSSTVKNTTGIENEKDIINFTDGFINQLSSPWFNYFMRIKPSDFLTKINCPVLALNGEKDIQIAAKPNLAGIKKALQKNKHVTTIEMPGLNHLFQHCKTCTVEEYGQLEETFDTATLTIIANWIKTERFK